MTSLTYERKTQVLPVENHLLCIHIVRYQHPKIDKRYIAAYVNVDYAWLRFIDEAELEKLGVTFQAPTARWLELPSATTNHRLAGIDDKGYWLGIDYMDEELQPLVVDVRLRLYAIVNRILAVHMERSQ